MKQIFPSAVSWWLFGPVMILLIGCGIYAALEKAWLEALMMVPVLGLFYWLLRYTYYEVLPGQHVLRVVAGPMVWRVPVQDITSMLPSYSPFSSPALSLDRLRVRYGQYNSVLISPADRVGFLAALLQLNPAIRHD
ncbi:PH domain-containing protein [Hymenobacter psychrophilus]|uniref:PH domain-containing protein n=1 Tax=Hymenobacter psychrophilus TaxID=651662 RepID=A0A1H3B063_9BACT|nr:PH domain-containing protein [Hymenobacter psychrophilus]SDX35051.1 PH domain-containing protein [Hymenobacter psychrophilus]